MQIDSTVISEKSCLGVTLVLSSTRASAGSQVSSRAMTGSVRKEQDRLSFRSGRRDSNPRHPPWQEGTTAFPEVTRRYKIAKSQPHALPGRSTRFAEVVLLVVLCDVELSAEIGVPLPRTANCRMLASMAHGSTAARLEARLPAKVHKLLKRAAELQGRTLTDFVVAAAHEAACRTIEEAEVVRFSIEDQRRIATAILKPPAPAPALKRAFRRRKALLRDA